MTRREFIRIMGRVKGDLNNSDVCWPWNHPDGYGRVSYRGKYLLIHNVLFDALKGKPASGLERHHTCENKSCANWNHIKAVTHRENLLIGLAHRNPRVRTHCKNGHVRTPENTYASVSTRGSLTTKCKDCHKQSRLLRLKIIRAEE